MSTSARGSTRCWAVGGFVLAVVLGVMLFALPATLSLPRGPRQGITELTLEEAAGNLRESGVEGWALVEAARLLVGDRMAYSRRNSFDSYRRAFYRGYGYCQQQAYALRHLLEALGFETQVVQSFRNRFPDGQTSGHAWVRVTFRGESRYVDPRYQKSVAEPVLFEPMRPVTGMSLAFRLFSNWGCTAANAYRFYRTGSDTDIDY